MSKSRSFKAHTGKMKPKKDRKWQPGQFTKQGFNDHTILECDMKTKRPDLRGNPK